jgi:hypothetical protein
MESPKLYVLPPRFETKTVEEVLEWATNEVLRLDAENIKLKERLERYEPRERVSARKAA